MGDCMLAQLYSRHDCLFKVFKNSLRPVIRLGKKTTKLRAMVELVRKWPERVRLRCHQNPSELGFALGSIKRFACAMQQASRLAGSVAGYVEA